MPVEEPSTEAKALTARFPRKPVNYAALLQNAATMRGVSQVSVAAEIVQRRLGRHRLNSRDYFGFGLYRPELTKADRDAFVSGREISQLNLALNPADIHGLKGIIDSKIMTELVLRGAGLPCSETIAMARDRPAPLPFPVLTGAAAIAAFLRDRAFWPIFGKPDGASMGIGAASLVAREDDDIVLGDGGRVPLRRLAEEIARDYPQGYAFQTLLCPHPDLAALIGPVVGTLRVLTLNQTGGPEPLFVMLKLPGPGAMVDGSLSGSNAAAIVDPDSGRIRRAQLLSAPIGQDLIESHVTGAPLADALLPDFREAVALALDAHRLFGGLGVLGSDVILSDRGPLINEVNLNPLASLVQKALGRGLFSAEFKAKYRAALAAKGIRLPIRGVRL